MFLTKKFWQSAYRTCLVCRLSPWAFHITCLSKAVLYLLVLWKAGLYFMDSKWSWYNCHCFWRASESAHFGYSVLELYVNEKCIWKDKCILKCFLDKSKHPLFSQNLNVTILFFFLLTWFFFFFLITRNLEFISKKKQFHFRGGLFIWTYWHLKWKLQTYYNL